LADGPPAGASSLPCHAAKGGSTMAGNTRSIRQTTRGLIVAAAILVPFFPIQSARLDAAGAAAARVDRQVTLPAGTTLRLRLNRGFGSDISRVEDPVSATLARSVAIGGRTVLPAGSAASGYV